MNEAYQLKTEYFQPIDHLYELLLKSSDLSGFISSSIEWITACLNRNGGAIYFIDPSLDFAPKWMIYNIPEMWIDQLNDSQSPLISAALKVYATQIPLEGNPQQQISAILPLKNNGNALGVLVISGEPLTQNEINLANILLHVFVRILLSGMHLFSQWKNGNLKSIFQPFTNSINLMTSDPNLAIINYVKGILNFFKAEYILFLQEDPETPNLLIKKLLGEGDDWKYQISQNMGTDFLERITHPQSSKEVQNLSINNESIPEILDLPNINIHSLIYSPILSKDEKPLGCLILINSRFQFGLNEKRLLQQYSGLFGDITTNLNDIQSMKISLAKMESLHLEVINSRNILREMFDNISFSIYIIDSAYTIRAINKARSLRLLLNPKQVVGKTCYEILFNRNSPCHACRVSETINKGKVTTRSWQEWISSESHIEWEVSTRPIYNDQQIPILAIVQEVDMTDKRTLEANLIQSEKLAAVGQLAAGVAHEINNPLSAIIANAQILLEESTNDNPDKIESLKLIETAGIRASHVVHNLLSISRKENQDFKPTDINRSIKNSLELIQHELIKNPIKVELDLCENLPLIMAQQDHLQGVWINFLLNSIDALVSANHQDGKLIIRTGFTDKEMQIEFMDNGKGIEAERIKKIFDPFYTTKSVGHGTGLGLSVCMRTIKEHQGNISVESKPGQGTRFTVTLPLNSEDFSE